MRCAACAALDPLALGGGLPCPACGPTTNREPPTGQFLGDVKQRLTVRGCQCTELKPLGVNPDHPEWGARFLIRFVAASGHELVWFAGEGGQFDPQVGGTYDVTCTVVKHDEYNGRRNTVVNRCADANAPKKTRKPKEDQP